MTRSRPDVCRRAHELSSAFLDGRLDAPRRAALQRHLRGCPSCLRNLRETERLARATHNLPPHRHAADLGARVLAATQQRRRDRVAALDGAAASDRGLRWLLAAALLGLFWAIGYHMGGNAGPAADASPLQPSHGDAAFAATSRRVLGDLTIAADLPPRQRRPLLESQLDLFDLRARARRVLAATPEHSAEHELAALVLDLGRALERDGVDWRRLGERAPMPQPPREPGARSAAAPPAKRQPDSQQGSPQLGTPRPAPADQPEPPLQRSRREQEVPQLVQRSRPEPPVQAVLARHGEDLTPTERDELADFLQLKRRLVSGEHVTAQEFHWTSSDGTTTVSGFSVASGFAGMRSLIESGDVEQADQLHRRMQDLLQALRDQEPAK
jgi:hypothetical protein